MGSRKILKISKLNTLHAARLGANEFDVLVLFAACHDPLNICDEH